MEAEYYRDGNYIWECKTSPASMGDPLNNLSLKKWVKDVIKVLKEEKPSGFRYIFPVNRLSSENLVTLQKLLDEFPDLDIEYYDCDKVENLINQLKKVNTLTDLVEYIEQARRNAQ